jgi:Tfp pilus assembly protein PilF
MNKALKIDPKESTSWTNRGLAYKNLGEKKFAIEDFKKGAELGDENGRINLKKFYNIDYPVSKVSKK